MALHAPVHASRGDDVSSKARTYVEARAAALTGDHQRSARLLASLIDKSASPALSRQAVSQAISAGDMPLALQLLRRLPADDMPVEATLLLVAEDLRAGRQDFAVQRLSNSGRNRDLAFIAPFLSAWSEAERGNAARALALIAAIPSGNALAAATDEHAALILLKLKRPEEAETYARRAIGIGGAREQRLRLALADGFLAAGDRGRALAMVEGMGAFSAEARTRILAGRSSGQAVDSTATAYSELLVRLAIELARARQRDVPIAITQVARHAAPSNSSATLFAAVLMGSSGRVDDALRALRTIDSTNAIESQARDLEVRTLVDADRKDEALAVAQAAVARRNPGSGDYSRLGDVLGSLNRHALAAEAYDQALARAPDDAEQRWPLLLLRANALEKIDRWKEAELSLRQALALAPDQPLILNFLGYARLERGEEMESAEAMIRKASALAPDDASITDSLGWALFKTGRVDQAIEVLQKAARSDPNQAEIQEHLGDALYQAGRRFEARFAWRAALAAADPDMEKRINAKLDFGLTEASAAP